MEGLDVENINHALNKQQANHTDDDRDDDDDNWDDDYDDDEKMMMEMKTMMKMKMHKSNSWLKREEQSIRL